MAGTWFSDEQIEKIGANPYTKQITPGQIQFTAELKEYLWQELGRERSASEVLRECGYDPEELGAKRVEGLARRVRQEGALGKGFHSGPRPKGEGLMSEACSEEQDELRKLRSEVDYLKAQITFLKRTLPLRGYSLEADVQAEPLQ